MLIFKWSVKLTAERLCWDKYPTFAIYSYCHLFTYRCTLLWVVWFLFKSRSTDAVLKLFDCFWEIQSVNVIKVMIWYCVIYLLTAIVLTPGGSSAVHICT
jgi:hypothetical protein